LAIIKPIEMSQKTLGQCTVVFSICSFLILVSLEFCRLRDVCRSKLILEIAICKCIEYFSLHIRSPKNLTCDKKNEAL
jgi:hypothetical protein